MHPYLEITQHLRLPTYGLAMAAGFLVALLVVRRLAPRVGLDLDRATEVAVWLVLGGLVGSRVTYALVATPEVGASRWELLLPWQPGHVWYGAFLGGVAALVLLRRRLGVPLADFADVCAPAVSVGHAFGRLGCFGAGCCWGREADLPWSVVFPPGGSCPLPGTPLHPTQLYEAGGELLVFGALLWIWRRRRFPGQVFFAYIGLYAALRFAVELFRGDATPGLVGLTLAQTTAIGLGAAAAVGWLVARRASTRDDG